MMGRMVELLGIEVEWLLVLYPNTQTGGRAQMPRYTDIWGLFRIQ
jgi:hypothetical protein